MRLSEFLEEYRKIHGAYESTDRIFHAKALCYCREKMNRRIDSTKPAIIIGTLVHLGIEKLLNYQPKVFTKRVGDYVVIGTPDYCDEDSVVEVKTTYYAPKKKPREPDELQLRIYMWLLGKKVGYLWYFSSSNYVEHIVREPATDEEVLDLIENPRIPMWPDECKRCDFYPCVHILRRLVE